MLPGAQQGRQQRTKLLKEPSTPNTDKSSDIDHLWAPRSRRLIPKANGLQRFPMQRRPSRQSAEHQRMLARQRHKEPTGSQRVATPRGANGLQEITMQRERRPPRQSAKHQRMLARQRARGANWLPKDRDTTGSQRAPTEGATDPTAKC